ncbi:LLM class flavin-dependent oxidoreductase [Oscillochloris sp. ZM17-4]|uniref:LLM class flavin-dependent oxidoreductase n=1 Tax=Oscillochloris sp. ZM17-4 TaxID=2866714 RepID=UPI001C735765|nr:LLM class flavin-dependent oxidoreductase [Oscillochloris sp. ZM17-4]MBX0329567.1 LLM class flavin-dependent oxidoreductase [Oscillochloris sp. ZM17-4]
MRFGIRLNSDSGVIREVVRRAQLAEELGFDDFWYCHDLMKRDAWVTLSAVAAATSRIRVGTCIVNPFSASPAEIAMAAASLQELSEGRFVLGIGPGDPPYLGWIGQAQARPRAGLAEAVAILRRLLRGEEAGVAGEVFAGWDPQARLRFDLPAQPIPIYIGGQGPRVLELMGEVADGGLPILFPPETIDFVRGRIAAGAARAGRDLAGFDLAACVWWSVAETRREAEDALRYLAAYYGPSLRAETLAPIRLTPADFDPVRDAWQAGDMDRAMGALTPDMFRLAIYGSPDDMLARLRWLAARGVTQINIGPPLGPDPEAALRLTARLREQL